jgi:predicted RND superfamily exporter protein
VAFAPDLDGGGGPRWLRRSVLDKQLKRQYDEFAQSGYLTTGDGQELWRISARVGPFRDMDYGKLMNEFRGQVEPAVDGARDKARIAVTYTGVMPVVYKARISLLRDLMFGLSTDLILIFVAMMLLMRHWSSGVLLLLTSVFPTALVFGALAWWGATVEIGALMAPCVALGVTVDDVIHFLLWFRRGIERGLTRGGAVLLAYDHCARPMCQSWAILGLGLAVLLFSSFVPNRQFGAAMVALLTVGLIGNLMFLPALLAGPLGAVIARGVKKRQAKERTRQQAAA